MVKDMLLMDNMDTQAMVEIDDSKLDQESKMNHLKSFFLFFSKSYRLSTIR
jgi:hypothetical protein